MSAGERERVRVGVVGVGALGQHHARIYAELEEAELVAVYDVRAERAREIAGRYGAVAVGSLGELATLVEAASVVVPTDRHREVALELMRQGVHLLVEKPIALSSGQAKELVEIAEREGLTINYVRFLHWICKPDDPNHNRT